MIQQRWVLFWGRGGYPQIGFLGAVRLCTSVQRGDGESSSSHPCQAESTYHCDTDTSLKVSWLAASRRETWSIKWTTWDGKLLSRTCEDKQVLWDIYITKVDPPSFLYAYTSFIPHIWLHNTLFSIVCLKSWKSKFLKVQTRFHHSSVFRTDRSVVFAPIINERCMKS